MTMIKKTLRAIATLCLLSLAFTANAAGQTIRFTGLIVHHPCPLIIEVNGELKQETNPSCLTYNKITTSNTANIQKPEINEQKTVKNVFYY